MLIQMFARGTGGGKGPIEYVTAKVVPEFEAKGARTGRTKTRNPLPEVLAGDPEMTRQLIDAVPNKWKYSSGVIAFADSDAPTNEQQRDLMADFERTAFAGLENGCYDILWVRHIHEGNVELHFVVPRLELVTGKALNVAPPGYEVLFDSFRDSWNFEHGWARPDDPARAQVVKRDAHTLKIEAAALKAGIATADDPKQLITEFLLQRIESGNLSNSADMLAALVETGVEINRQGKDYISIRPEPGAKPIRLKGEIYGEGFNVSGDRVATIRAELREQLGRQAKEKDQGGAATEFGNNRTLGVCHVT